MGYKKWIVPKVDKDRVKLLAEECDIDPFLALIAASRGYEDPVVLDEFLSDDAPLGDPFAMIDMQKAADCVNSAIEDKKLIAVYGDYDCDGVTSTALLYTYLSSRGADVVCYIPDRVSEGYGINMHSVERLSGMGVELIITVDNGINSVDEIEYAVSLGMQVVVTDHHLPAGALPHATAVVDPHRQDCPSYFKELAGVGVAFGLVCAMENAVPEEQLPEYADYLALGTVADVMPLTGENRTFVRAGLRALNSKKRLGFTALINVAGLDGKFLSAGNLSFHLAPRINAAGRMGDAMRAFRLLTSSSYNDAMALAKEIDSENTLRQRIESEIVEQASNIISTENLEHDRVIVVSGSGWHRGVIGIAASKLAERFSRPVIVLSTDGETAVGSGRSVTGFSLFDALFKASDLLIRFGGHALAAGLTLDADKIDAFREIINLYAQKMPYPVPEIKLDCKLNPSALTIEMGEVIKELEPFGVGNPSPLFGIYFLKIERISAIGGGKHLRLLLTRESAVVQTLLFGCTEEQFPFDVGDTVDIAVTLDVNVYHGEPQLSIVIRSVRASGIDDDLTVESIKEYDDFFAAGGTTCSAIMPTREEIGEVYRFCCKGVSRIKAVNKLASHLAYGKILISIDILLELGILIENKRDNCSLLCASGERAELSNSEIYKKLKGGDR